MEYIWQRTGFKPALLEDEVEFYPAVLHIWTWFLKLHKTRGGGFGPAPITYQEIFSWARISKIGITPWEAEQIRKIDDIWFKVQAEKDKEKTKGKNKKAAETEED